MKLTKRSLIGMGLALALVASLGGAALAASAADTEGEDATPKQEIRGMRGPGKMDRGDLPGGPGKMGEGGLFFGGLFGLPEGQNITDYTDELVKAGIISSETADKLAAYVTEKAASAAEEREKLQAMTPEEKKAYLESKRDELASDKLESPVLGSELVSKGILTQEELDKILAYAKEQMESKRNTAMEDKLSSLVNDNTITAEQKAAILAYLQKEPLKELMEAANLTQEQAESVSRALFRTGNGPFHRIGAEAAGE